MTSAVALIVVIGVVLGVLAKIGWDAVGILREERREHGHVTSYGVFRVGIVALIVLLFLGWLVLGWALGGSDPYG